MCEMIDKIIKERLAEQFAVAQTLKLPKQIIIKVLMISEEQYEKMLLDYNHNDV